MMSQKIIKIFASEQKSLIVEGVNIYFLDLTTECPEIARKINRNKIPTKARKKSFIAKTIPAKNGAHVPKFNVCCLETKHFLSPNLLLCQSDLFSTFSRSVDDLFGKLWLAWCLLFLQIISKVSNFWFNATCFCNGFSLFSSPHCSYIQNRKIKLKCQHL